MAYLLVDQRLQWCGNLTGTLNQFIRAEGIDRHDRCTTEKTTEFDKVAFFFSRNGDDTNRCCFSVDHANGCFISNHSRRSEEHTSNSSHVSISYAVFCLKKKKQ